MLGPPELVTKAHMAKEWGVSRQVVKNWELRDSRFPQPALYVNGGDMALYMREDMEKYKEERDGR